MSCRQNLGTQSSSVYFVLGTRAKAAKSQCSQEQPEATRQQSMQCLVGRTLGLRVLVFSLCWAQGNGQGSQEQPEATRKQSMQCLVGRTLGLRVLVFSLCCAQEPRQPRAARGDQNAECAMSCSQGWPGSKSVTCLVWRTFGLFSGPVLCVGCAETLGADLLTIRSSRVLGGLSM